MRFGAAKVHSRCLETACFLGQAACLALLLLCIHKCDWDHELSQFWAPYPRKLKVGVVDLAALDIPLLALWVLSP